MPLTLDEFHAQRLARPTGPVRLAEPLPLSALPTPALVVDLGVLERNLDYMAGFLAQRDVGLRPHAKMHKCPEVARRQLERGAVGICTAKLAEAEVMRAAGIEHILITSPLVADAAIARAVALSARCADLRMVVDDVGVVARLGAAAHAAAQELRVVIDLDPDMGRTGVARGQPALDLARAIAATPGVRLTGLQQYAGQLQHIEDAEARLQGAREALASGLATRDLIRDDGHELEIFTGGGTGTFDFDSATTGFTDLQCGSYAFMDAEYSDIHYGNSDRFEVFEPSLFVLVTAISQPRAGLITVDGGLKSFASDASRPVALDSPGVRYHFGGDEHGILKLAKEGPAPKIGEQLRFMTPHCDPTVNLYDWIHVLEGDLVTELWPIAARGCSW